jgi:predicted ATP-dependent endonuclease of OLD family
LISEILEATASRRVQIVTTTHSPYLLDLLPLDAICFVERAEAGPVFSRPEKDEEVKEWAKRFGPGRLYTMGRFSRSGDR